MVGNYESSLERLKSVWPVPFPRPQPGGSTYPLRAQSATGLNTALTKMVDSQRNRELQYYVALISIHQLTVPDACADHS